MGKRLEQLISKLNGKRENLPWNNRYLIPIYGRFKQSYDAGYTGNKESNFADIVSGIVSENVPWTAIYVAFAPIPIMATLEWLGTYFLAYVGGALIAKHLGKRKATGEIEKMSLQDMENWY
ncbi:MAG: hypothetical protein M1348_01565 [Candidatus Parvarchaeota archaeon]|nr:hypothetical protein [Candidatus Parvarchaeota archaeon]MCL5101281.1 hypothetical protein [Candidatus Parvarchaeota archaeon]